MTKKITSKNIIIIITTVILMGLVVFIVGRSYGFFAYKKEGTTANIISIKGLVANITANPNALTLNEAEPLYDEDGLALAPFTFTVTNTSSIPSSFTLKIVNDTDRLSACKINEGTQEEAQCPALALSNIRYSYKIGDGEYSTPANLGETNIIDAGDLTQNQTKTYYIKLWIKSDATNDIMDKYFFGKIIIEGTKKNTITYDFDYTGNVQEFVAPKDGVYKLEVWGAQGQNNDYQLSSTGGPGGYSTGMIILDENDKLSVVVGGTEGYNGGGQGTNPSGTGASSGGGATHIAQANNSYSILSSYVNASTAVNYILLVAGGGGAGGNIPATNTGTGYGGSGGGLVGSDGVNAVTDASYVWAQRPGKGGTQTEGGVYGLCYSGTQCGISGTFGQGGGTYNCNTSDCLPTSQAGGGGGWYGGGSGRHTGGGGGSSYIGGIINGQTISGNQTIIEPDGTSSTGHTGNGYARITYLGNESDNLNMKIMLANANTRNVVIPDSELKDKSNEDSAVEYRIGLFKAIDTNGGYTYYYRGNVDNNYLKIGNDIWRIVRINEDSTVRIIKESVITYNSTTDFAYNNTKDTVSYMYYTNGTDNGTNYDAYTILNNWYATNIQNNNNYSNIVTTGTYCQAAKVMYESYATGNATMALKENYIPSLSCPMNDGNITNGKLTLNVGLINIDELALAGAQIGGNANDYYLKTNTNHAYWTMSPAAVRPGANASAWSFNNWTSNTVVSLTLKLRPVINLKADIEVTGTGTISDPYIIK